MASGDGWGPFVIEPMEEQDIPQILEIEREAFALTWSPGAYRRELRWNRLARYLVLKEKRVGAFPEPPVVLKEENPGRRLLSLLWRNPSRANVGDRVLGYVGQWLMLDESHLITIAVRQEYRHQGLGESLLIAALDQAVQMGARAMTLEVRASNLAAQAMYEKFDFRKVGLRPRYYTDNNEDGVLMASDALAAASFQGRLQRLKAENREKVGVLWPP